MAKEYKFIKNNMKEDRVLDAAESLECSGFLEQAVLMQWISLRSLVFGWLDKKLIQYNSTREALVLTMSSQELSNIRDDLAFAYLVGTLSEWDESFTINSEQLSIYKNFCENVRLSLIV